jgi:hypothetical protein
VAEILDRLGSSADDCQARLEKLRQARRLGVVAAYQASASLQY